MEIGFNLPAFLIALVITAILVVGIKESARFNATIVVIKVSVVLFVIALGSHYINRGKLGYGLALVRAARLGRNLGRARLTYSSPTLALMRFRPRRRRPRIRNAICPSA